MTTQEFKAAVKQHKAITQPIRKTLSYPAQVIGDRQIKFIFSSPSVDRDWDVIKQDGIDVSNFARNPVVLWSHEHDSIPIGKCVSIGIENGNLTGVVEFAPADNPAVGAKAQGIFELCRDGFISTVSIGFIPTEIEFPDGERLTHDGIDVIACEMVELSLCPIPSNRDALIQQVGAIAEPAPDIPAPAAIIPPKQYRAARLRRVLASLPF